MYKRVDKMKKSWGSPIERVSTVRLKLITAFTSLFIITFIFISLAGYIISKSVISKNIDIQASEVMEGHAAEIDQWVKRMLSIINSYSHLIERAVQDKNITSEILGNYSRDSFSDLYYGSSSGKLVSGKGWKPPEGYDPRSRPWYIAALKSGRTIMCDVYNDLETNTPAVAVASPVYSRNGSLRGVLSADLLIHTLDEKLRHVKVKGMGHAMLIDRNGMALVYPDRDTAGRNLLGIPGISSVIGTMLKDKRGRVEYTSLHHNIIIFTRIPASGWILGMILTEEEIYSNLKTLTLKFFMIFAVSLVVVILTSKYFAVKLTFFMQLLEQTVDEQTAALKEKIAQVEYLSLTDHLTGISNRRKTEEILSNEIERSSRTGSQLSVIMIDIDNFKTVNDTHGHKAGDFLLKEFASTITRSIRSIDSAGRIGGEEFLIICPETGIHGAVMLAEKLRAAVESIKIESIPPITASFGCARYNAGDSMDKLISRSDTAMYRAKELGRNRVENII